MNICKTEMREPRDYERRLVNAALTPPLMAGRGVRAEKAHRAVCATWTFSFWYNYIT